MPTATLSETTLDWKAQPRQDSFLSRGEDEVLYGGAAGGGKSDALLLYSILRRTKYAGSKGLFLRRTYADLSKAGSALDRSKELLSGVARYDQQQHRWTFPNSSTHDFGYLDHEDDKYHFQSAQYDDICVLRGTPVLMGDGTWKQIQSVQVGEHVATMEGPRIVTRTHAMGVQPVCEVRTIYGCTVVSTTHRLLLADGTWASPQELLPTQCPPSDNSGAASPLIFRDVHRQDECLQLDQLRVPELVRQDDAGMDRQDFGVCSVSGQSDCEASEGAPPVVQQPNRWDGRLMLLSRALRSMVWGGGGVNDAACAPSPQDSPSDYPAGLRSGGGRVHASPVTVLSDIQLPGDVEAQSPGSLRLDGLESTPAHIQQRYVHPYTKELRARVEDVRPVVACIVPAGEGEVFDLTVASASHFIVFPGIIAQNCFDELTQFSESQYLYLLSRCRATVDGIAPRVRAGCNPGGVGHQWVKARFVDAAPYETRFELPRQEGQGQVRHGCFVPARLQDNQILMDRDPGYWDRLMALPEHDRRALAYGDWDVFAGQYFSEWRRDKHVIDPFTPPAHWRRFAGLDWGHAKPLAYLLLAQDPDTGRLFVLREVYAAGLRDAEAIARIKAIEGQDRIDARWADPSMWTKRSNDDALSTADVYLRAGLVLQPASNDRLNGWRRLHDLLADGKDERPMLQVCRNCTELIRTLPGLVHDQTRPEDLDSDGEDHASDALRYCVASRLTAQLKDPPLTMPFKWG